MKPAVYSQRTYSQFLRHISKYVVRESKISQGRRSLPIDIEEQILLSKCYFIFIQVNCSFLSYLKEYVAKITGYLMS
jgi:hypothetical protein